jgi:ABC-type uncharacterized transport system substrate-binding protein
VEPIGAPVRSNAEIERVITSLGREPGSGLVASVDAFTFVHHAQIILPAAGNTVPTVSEISSFARNDGLLSYGPDTVDIFRRSASYVDRILRGEKPADLPVQLPVKFDMAVNLKTAKALSLAVPQSILLRRPRRPRRFIIQSPDQQWPTSGMVWPRALPVLRLMTSSNLVASWTGSSPGFSPLRTRPP